MKVPGVKVLLAFAATGLLSCLGASGAEVTIVSTGRNARGLLSSFELAFEANEEPLGLWFVSGKTDGGDQIGNWDHLEFVAEIPSGRTTYSVPSVKLPSGSRVMRLLLMKDNPDIVELESVSTTGEQYLITDYTPTGLTKVRCDFRYDSLDGSSAMWSGRAGSYENTFCMLQTAEQGFRMDYGTVIDNTLVKPRVGNRYLAEMDYTGLRIAGNPTVNYARPGGPANFTAGAKLTLGALNTKGAISAPAVATFYAFKVWSDTRDTAATLKHDLVPCRKGDAVGFCNRVDGSFLPSSSSSAFVPGAAKSSNSLGEVVGRSAVLYPCGADRRMTVKRFYSGMKRAKADLQFTPALSDGTLVAVYGPEDAGDKMSDWPNRVMLGAVPADATEMTVTIPEKLTDEMKCFRFFLVARFGSETYDRLFEGVRATGSQYVLTGIVPTGSMHVMAGFSFNDISGSQVPFSARTAAFSDSFSFLYTADQGYRFDYRELVANSQVKGVAGERFTMEMHRDGLIVNGKMIASRPETISKVFVAGSELTIFALNSAGTVNTFARAECQYFKAWSQFGDDKSRVLDLVPCEKDGEIGFYNKVDGRFFGNDSGVGTFEQGGAELANPNAAVFAVTETLAAPLPPGLLLIVR